MSFAEVRALARERRVAASTGDGTGVDDIDALLEAVIAGEDLTFMLLREGSPYGREVLGLLHRRARLLRVAERLDGPRRRAVAAHELGHWFLHPDPRLELTKLNFPVAGGPVEGYSPAELKEVQADVFAAEFLCPCDTLRADFARGLRPSDTARRLGIPVGLALAQAAEALLGEAGTVLAEPVNAVEPDPTRSLAAALDASHLLVEGAPSSGRTTTVASRVELLLGRGRSPATIAVIASSDHAVDRLRRRFDRLAGGGGVQVWSGTMRGYCKELLRKYSARAGLSPAFAIVDDVAAIGIVLKAARADDHGHAVAAGAPSAAERARAAAIYRRIAAFKHGPAPSASAARTAGGPGAVVRRYDDALRSAGALDAADLATRALDLLEGDAEIASRVAQLHADILVDDYDDLTRRQQQVLRVLAQRGARIFATAGPTGSIDGFPGADAAGARSFADDHPGAMRIALPGRRDCIVPGARVMRALASPRPCAPARGSGLTVGATVVACARDEASAIARRSREWESMGMPARRQVVLARTHRALDRLAADLRALGMPILHDGEADGREAIADLLAVAGLRNERGGRALSRVAALPVYAIAPAEIAAAAALAQRSGVTGLEAVRRLSVEPHPNARDGVGRGFARLAADFAGLERSASAFEFVSAWLFERSDHLASLPAGPEGSQARRALRHFLGVCEEHERQGDRDDANLARRLARLRSRTQDTAFRRSLETGQDGDAMAMMTVHAARGRKFDGVHLAALPPPCARGSGGAREARVFETAVTRARSKLHLTRCLDGEVARWEGGLPYVAMGEGP